LRSSFNSVTLTNIIDVCMDISQSSITLKPRSILIDYCAINITDLAGIYIVGRSDIGVIIITITRTE